MATERIDRLLAVLPGAVEALGIPGAAVGVLDGETSTTWSAGVTSLDHPLPVTDTTMFQIGSISKTFVGTAAMVLVDRGRLGLDVPIRAYLPGLRLSSEALADTVAMRHLLTHTTGWVGDYFADTGEGDDALERFVAKLAKAPQLTPVGSTYSYNNSAFNLAAHVIATVTGMPFERAMHDLVLHPLGLHDTTYRTDDVIGRRVATGYRGGAAQPWRRARAHNGNGGVLSCVRDLLAYARFHLGDGSPIMSPAALELMHRPQRPAGSLCDEVGLVWMIDRLGGHTVVHHGGTTNGFQADLRIVPELGLGSVMLTNCDHHHQLDRVITSTLLGEASFAEDFVPDDLVPFVGHYEAVLAELDVTIGPEGLLLEVSTPDRAVWNRGEDPGAPVTSRLAFRDEDRVICRDLPYAGHRGEFLRGPDGTVEWMRWDGRIARRTSGTAQERAARRSG